MEPTAENFICKQYEDGLEITDYTGGTDGFEALRIPFEINEKKVLSIRENAFEEKWIPADLIIPDTVKNIGINAFHANSFTSLVLGSSVNYNRNFSL